MRQSDPYFLTKTVCLALHGATLYHAKPLYTPEHYFYAGC